MEPPSKKAKVDGAETRASADAIRRYEAEGALEVDVEDGMVMVHPSLLALASPVFAAMLCTDMHEKRQQKLTLPGKKKADLELFLEFVRPCSRKCVDSDTVDTMLPWFDEYQVHELKEECQKLLLSLPVNSQRLLQAYRFGLERQYPRCLEGLSFQDYKTNFAELAAVPAALRDLRPHLESKQPRAKRFFTLVDNFAEKDGDLKDMLPILAACLEGVDGATFLSDDLMPVLVDLNEKRDPIQVALSMLKLLSKNRNNVANVFVQLDSEVYGAIPLDAKRLHSNARLDAWVRDRITAAKNALTT